MQLDLAAALRDIDGALAALVDIKPMAEYGEVGTYDTVQARRQRALAAAERSLLDLRHKLNDASGVGVVQTPGLPAKLPAVTTALNMCMAANSEAKLPVPMCWDLALYVQRLEAAVAAGVQPSADAERIAELEEEVTHVRRWYGDRLEILSAWARESLKGEQLHTFFNIVANARPHVSDEPEWFRAVIAKLAAKARTAGVQPSAERRGDGE
jgi:hypothetical protein